MNDKIYIVFRSGFEWNDALKAFKNKSDAGKWIESYKKKDKHFLADMSKYKIKKIELL